MKLTPTCQKLMNFFMKNDPILNKNQTKQTNSILMTLYKDIYQAYTYLHDEKEKSKKNRDSFYHVSIQKINNIRQIPKPRNFNMKSFPLKIREHIDEMALYEITYMFSLFERKIKIHFVVENEHPELKIHLYHDYIDSIFMWLYIVNLHSSKMCSKSLVVFFYFTSLKKGLPSSNIHVLDETHVNTAFTSTCEADSEIIVFRKEEWFKVFIHESFHNFGLDFSDMNNEDCRKEMTSIFKVNSEVNLYEAYSEFWAEIINCLFCSFTILPDKTDTHQFLSLSKLCIHFEMVYSFFQLVKVLDFMGIKYTDLYSNSKESEVLRNHLYKEKTNVLAYYVIKTILLSQYQNFLFFCKENHFSLLQFKKTIQHKKEFCDFIRKKYKTKDMLDSIESTEKLLKQCYTRSKKKDVVYLLTNLRMTLFELG